MRIVPGKSFLIAGTVAWAGLIAAMISIPRDAAMVMASAPAFNARWEETLEEPSLLKKGDRLPLPVMLAPIKLAPVERPAVVLATVAEPDEEKPRKRVRTHERERNVCGRHGLRKVWVTRKYWRCRK